VDLPLPPDPSQGIDHHPARRDLRPLFTRREVTAAFAAFALLGAINAFYGPSIPALRSRFGLAPAQAGLALSMFYVGAVAGVLAGASVHRRVGNGRLLVISLTPMALGALGFALAPNWPCALAASLFSGFGAGGIDYGLNGLFAVGFGRRSPAMLGILNAFYGLGAVLGPIVIDLLGARRYPIAFAGASVLLVGTAWLLRTVRTARGDPLDGGSVLPTAEGGSGERHAIDAARSRRRVLLAVVFAFLALYALQVAIETGVGAWEPTYLQSLGRGVGFAADATSGFWLMLMIGRLLVAPLSLRWSEPTIVSVGCLGTTVCLALAAIPAAAPYALAGAGLFNAPVFPAALPWLNRAAPDVRWASMGAVLTANLGGVAAGPLLGLAIESFGRGAVPVVLTATSTVCLALALRLAARHRPSAGPPSLAFPE
jgi:MFS transporter, FHS family, glucose/mannose:H+ symporter